MKTRLLVLAAFAALPAAAQLRISEICPQPATTNASTGEIIDRLDPNGKVSGWIELENTSATETVDLANYQIVRTHRGKKIKKDAWDPAWTTADHSPGDYGTSKLPSRSVGPGERVLVYTSDEYDNDEEANN